MSQQYTKICKITTVKVCIKKKIILTQFHEKSWFWIFGNIMDKMEFHNIFINLKI